MASSLNQSPQKIVTIFSLPNIYTEKLNDNFLHTFIQSIIHLILHSFIVIIIILLSILLCNIIAPHRQPPSLFMSNL
jgi:hypothetical protein